MKFDRTILDKLNLTHKDICTLLSLSGNEMNMLFEKARGVRSANTGNKVYLRGLIEYSNVCAKNCYYCGIRRGNRNVQRYTMSDNEVLECAKFAFHNQYGSIVIQAGERSDKEFVNKIAKIVREIKVMSYGKLGITLSLGEQSPGTYKKWFDAGAHRYLLRIEEADRDMFFALHPDDGSHNFEKRLKALRHICQAGFQTGTGVMIGLPGQTIENLARDLLFLKKMNVDMVGMGPYIEHRDTPLYEKRFTLLPLKERFELSLKMISVLRLMMPDINMAATTAMQAIDPEGREKAILAGANIIMPNITPLKYRKEYLLYNGKPCLDEDAVKCTGCLISRIKLTGSEVGLNEWGDSKHFKREVISCQ